GEASFLQVECPALCLLETWLIAWPQRVHNHRQEHGNEHQERYDLAQGGDDVVGHGGRSSAQVRSRGVEAGEVDEDTQYLQVGDERIELAWLGPRFAVELTNLGLRIAALHLTGRATVGRDLRGKVLLGFVDHLVAVRHANEP